MRAALAVRTVSGIEITKPIFSKGCLAVLSIEVDISDLTWYFSGGGLLYWVDSVMHKPDTKILLAYLLEA